MNDRDIDELLNIHSKDLASLGEVLKNYEFIMNEPTFTCDECKGGIESVKIIIKNIEVQINFVKNFKSSLKDLEDHTKTKQLFASEEVDTTAITKDILKLKENIKIF